MTKSVKNALKAMGILTAIAVVCVGILTVCNMYFPKYKPTLDASTARMINDICPTGVEYDTAMSDGYIVMLDEDDFGGIASFNKANKSAKAEVLAVYGEPKGNNAGAFIIECSSTGRDGDVSVLVAYRNGKVAGAVIKKQNESYFDKLPENVLSGALGTDGKIDSSDLAGKTGATVTLGAITRAVNISGVFAAENGQRLEQIISTIAETSAESGVNA